MSDMFLSRVNVALGDMAALVSWSNVHSTKADSEWHLHAAVALTGLPDVNAPRSEIIKRSIKTGQSGIHLLDVFWNFYGPHTDFLSGFSHRVFINPPYDLPLKADATLNTLPVRSTYGARLDSINSFPLADNVLVFNAENLDLPLFVDQLLVGMTIALAQPGKLHAHWMRYLGINLHFDSLMDSIAQRFNLKPLLKNDDDNAMVVLFGLEPK